MVSESGSQVTEKSTVAFGEKLISSSYRSLKADLLEGHTDEKKKEKETMFLETVI